MSKIIIRLIIFISIFLFMKFLYWYFYKIGIFPLEIKWDKWRG